MLKTRFNLSAQESGAMGKSREGRFYSLGCLTFCCFAVSLIVWRQAQPVPLSGFGIRLMAAPSKCAQVADKMTTWFQNQGRESADEIEWRE